MDETAAAAAAAATTEAAAAARASVGPSLDASQPLGMDASRGARSPAPADGSDDDDDEYSDAEEQLLMEEAHSDSDDFVHVDADEVKRATAGRTPKQRPLLSLPEGGLGPAVLMAGTMLVATVKTRIALERAFWSDVYAAYQDPEASETLVRRAVGE